MPVKHHLSEPTWINTDKLLFDPNNFRLKINNFDEIKYNNEKLSSEEVQKDCFLRLKDNPEFKVDDLVKRIKQSGFPKDSNLTVEKIESNQYLVLEGNRRLCAARQLLSQDKTQLLQDKNKPGELLCFVFKKKQKYSRAEAIQELLLQTNVFSSRLEHSQLQKASQIYDAYMTQFLKRKGGKERFVRNDDVIRQIAEEHDKKKKEILIALSAFCLWKQLKDAGHEVEHKFYERLTWPIKDPKWFEFFFGFGHEQTFKLSHNGLDIFNDLFIGEHAAVTNPTLNRYFSKVMRQGPRLGKIDIAKILEDPYPKGKLEEIAKELAEKKKGDLFIDGLKRVWKILEKIEVKEAKKTRAEKELVKKIKRTLKGFPDDDDDNDDD